VTVKQNERLSIMLSLIARHTTVGRSSRFFHASAVVDLAKLNVEGLAERVDLRGKNVLVRVDLNVPLAKVSIHT
jgi:hypothetical protein